MILQEFLYLKFWWWWKLIMYISDDTLVLPKIFKFWTFPVDCRLIMLSSLKLVIHQGHPINFKYRKQGICQRWSVGVLWTLFVKFTRTVTLVDVSLSGWVWKVRSTSGVRDWNTVNVPTDIQTSTKLDLTTTVPEELCV